MLCRMKQKQAIDWRHEPEDDLRMVAMLPKTPTVATMGVSTCVAKENIAKLFSIVFIV